MTEDKIAVAGRWLAEHWEEAERPLLRTLRNRFALNFADAAKAMAEARRHLLKGSTRG